MGKIKIIIAACLIVFTSGANAGCIDSLTHGKFIKIKNAINRKTALNLDNPVDAEMPVPGKGLFRTTLTFATGYMPANKLNNLYLTGNIEYYTDNKISVRGDAMYFFNSMNGDKTLKKNHSLYGGAAYHFVKGNFDPFIGLQAGLAYTQCGIVLQDGKERSAAYNPLISPVAGFNYYAQKWVHLFINMRYNVGRHLSDDAIIPLNELNFSFGLGFNIK